MRLTVLVAACFLGVALAAPQQRYTIRRPQNAGVSLHQSARDRRQQFRVRLEDSGEDDLRALGGFAQAPARSNFRVSLDDSIEDSSEEYRSCPAGQLRHGNRCVVPRINRNIFVFGKEDEPEPKELNVNLPLPEIDYNIIFVRSRPKKQRRPVIIPPPQKKTVVYVLEDEEESGESVIEVDDHPALDPEVYYVKVREGENPKLPGGLDLQTAYSQAIRPLQSINTVDHDSIEITLSGAPGGSGFGVPLPSAGGQGGFGGGNQGGFRGDQGGFGGDQGGFGGGNQGGFGGQQVGVPLPPPSGGASFNSAGGAFIDNEDDIFGVQDAGGRPLPGFQGGNAGGAGFGQPQGGPGVPLPDFQGGAGGGFGGDPGFRGDQGFGGQDQGGRFGGPNPPEFSPRLEVEIDDGRLKVEPASSEAVSAALRYNIPE